jgi:mannose-6-phosphate isomerase
MDRLENPVRHYAWGSARDIPDFLGVPPDGTPQAELWMGAHPGDSSRVLRGGAPQALAALIAADPAAELGPAVAAQYGGQLPFLFKLLSAGQPLSLQVHPDRARAAARFADPAYADDYTDGNHKPEVICALRDGFEALSGFRPVPATIALLDELAVPGLAASRELLASQPGAAGLAVLVTEILTGVGGTGAGGTGARGTGAGGTGAAEGEAGEAAGAAATIADVGRAGQRLAEGGGPWAAAGRAYARLAAAYPGDPGVLVAVLLNHAVLAAGEALFTAAGVPHCYLDGFGAELMAASDNVLRAGLTSKRVNVAELLEVLDFRPAPLEVLHPVPDGVLETYPVPVPDFRLGRLVLAADPVALPGGPQILLGIAGAVRLRAPGGAELELQRGQSAYLGAGCAGVTAAGPGTALRAGVGS